MCECVCVCVCRESSWSQHPSNRIILQCIYNRDYRRERRQGKARYERYTRRLTDLSGRRSSWTNPSCRPHSYASEPLHAVSSPLLRRQCQPRERKGARWVQRLRGGRRVQRLRGGRGLTGEGIEVGQWGEVHTEKQIVPNCTIQYKGCRLNTKHRREILRNKDEEGSHSLEEGYSLHPSSPFFSLPPICRSNSTCLLSRRTPRSSRSRPTSL